DLDLRLAARGGPDVLQPEPAQHPVVGGAFPLALQDHHVDRGLVVIGGAGGGAAGGGGGGGWARGWCGGGRGGAGGAARRGGAAVEQEAVFDPAVEHGGLDGGAQRDHLVRVDRHVRVLAAGQPPHLVLHGGDPGGAADQDHLVDVGDRQLRVGDGLLHRAGCAFHSVGPVLVERRPAP